MVLLGAQPGIAVGDTPLSLGAYLWATAKAVTAQSCGRKTESLSSCCTHPRAVPASSTAEYRPAAGGFCKILQGFKASETKDFGATHENTHLGEKQQKLAKNLGFYGVLKNIC